ncbi:MAG: tetratricopeptide repeat protein [Peptococcaceae bacterium]
MELEKLLQSWLKAVRDHDFTGADGLYTQIVSRAPLYQGIHYPMGVWYKELGFNDKAFAAFQRALRSDPQIRADTYYYLGNVTRNQNKFNDAAAFYQKALEVDPDFFEAHYNLGKVYEMLGKNDKALKHFQKALQLNPDDADTYVNLGVGFSNAGLKEKALEMYERALALDPQSYLVYSNMGVEYAELGDFRKAISFHKKALELNSFYGDAWYNLGCTFALAGDYSNALSSLEKAFKLDEENIKYAENDPELGELRQTRDYRRLLKTDG